MEPTIRLIIAMVMDLLNANYGIKPSELVDITVREVNKDVYWAGWSDKVFAIHMISNQPQVFCELTTVPLDITPDCYTVMMHCMRENDKLGVIRALRELVGCDLKQALEAVREIFPTCDDKGNHIRDTSKTTIDILDTWVPICLAPQPDADVRLEVMSLYKMGLERRLKMKTFECAVASDKVYNLAGKVESMIMRLNESEKAEAVALRMLGQANADVDTLRAELAKEKGQVQSLKDELVAWQEGELRYGKRTSKSKKV